MGWLILLILLILVALYLKHQENKPDVSMLPEQFIVLDLETTGLDPIKNEIIEIGAVRVNRDSNEHSTFQVFIKPKKKVPKKITEMTGITQEMLDKDGDDLASALSDLSIFIGNLRIVAFNASFDMGFLKHAGLDLSNPVSCALKMARRAWPGLQSYKLADLAKSGGLNVEGTHRALKDCELTIIVFAKAASDLGSVK